MNHTFGGSLFLRGGVALVSMAAMLLSAVWPQQVVAQDVQPAVSSASAKVTSFGETINKLHDEISAQEKTDELILSELHSGLYTEQQPLLLDNPYGSSPLTALLVFTTETPASVHVRVKGKTADADIANSFPKPETQHIIPIYGLYPDYLNTIEVTTTYSSGLVNETTLQLQTEAIEPKTIDQIKIQTDFKNTAAIGDGVNFLFMRKLAFDAYGDIRWVNNTWATANAVLYNYQNGTYITPFGASYQEGDVLLIERNLLGKFLRVWYSPYGAHHEIEEGANGNLLVAGNKGETTQDFIYELDRRTGEIVNSLELKTILPRTSERNDAALLAQTILKIKWGINESDWFHLNTIFWEDGDVILSGRHTSTVAKVAWPSGEIRWILASPYGWPSMYQNDLFTPVEDQTEFEWPYWQHAPRILPDQDNNPDTTDILLFDNGTVRFGNEDVLEALQTGNLAAIKKYSRMVQYRIDKTAGTIEQVWQYGKERGEELYSERCGNAELLSNGNRIGLFMIESIEEENPSSHSVISEVNAAGDLVWEAMLTSETGQLLEYRVERLPLYHESDQYLWLRQSAQILIPASVLKANGVQLAP